MQESKYMRLVENKVLIHDRPITVNLKYLKKLILANLLSFVYPTVLWLDRLKRIKTRKKYDVAVCTIFKDEAISLKEWLDYHIIVGIEHFYLYNNFSTDNYQEVIKPYIEKGIVTLKDWPVKKGQVSAYQHCFETNRMLSAWIFFIDIDEFVCPKKEDTIHEWLSKYANFPSIVIYWKMFGTSGRLNHNKSLPVIEQYTNSWDKLDGIGKSVVNTNFDIRNFNDFHRLSTTITLFGFKVVVPPVNEFKKFIFFGINRVGSNSLNDSRIQINHYWSKSYNCYTTNKAKRGPVTSNTARDLNLFYLHEKKNISSDFSIWRFLIKLKTGEADKKLKS